MKDQKPNIQELTEIARQLRIQDLKVIHEAGSGHPGGSLSAADIITALYFYKMKHKATDPKWAERDRFVLSKGHVCPIVYCALARLGYFSEDELWKLRKIGNMLQGHPDRNKTPGIEVSTGSLGQGISVAVGMAIATKLDGYDSKIYCMIGDGEAQEGSVWEAIMSAVKFKLDNLVLIIDNNQIQQTGFVKDVMDIGPIAEKMKAFNWECAEIDGNNMNQVVEALDNSDEQKGPFCIIAHTLKGKGVSFMELNKDFHGRAPTDEELEKAISELGGE